MILEEAMGVILSDCPVPQRKKILESVVVNFADDPEAQVFHRIKDLFDKSGGFPSDEFVVNDLGYTGQIICPDGVRTADIIGKIEKAASERSRRKASESLLDLSKNIMTLPIQDVRQRLDKTTMMLSDGSSEKVDVPIRDSYKIQKEQTAGLLTFIKPVDNAIGGVRKGTMLTIAAFAKHFKTSTAVSMLYQNCVELKQNGIKISLEMPKEILMYYMLSRHSYNPKFSSIGDPVEKDKLIHATLSPEEEKFIFDTVEPDLRSDEYGSFRILDRTDFDSMSFSGITSRLYKVPFDIDFLAVDYIQLFKYVKEAQFLRDPANEYVGFFRNLAIDFHGKPISMVLLAQTNREGYRRAVENDGEYDLLALAELNALERDSAHVMFLYTDDNLKSSGELKINLPANRFGDSFQDPVTTFVDPRFCVVGEQIEGLGELSGSVDFSDILMNSSFEGLSFA